MYSYLFDIAFLLIVLAVTYLVARRWSLIHCATAFVSVLIASLLAITTFEALATWVNRTYLTSTDNAVADNTYFAICLTVFGVALFLLLRGIHNVLPIAPILSPRAERFGRWGFAALTGYLFASFLLCAVMAIPAPRHFWGLFEVEPSLRSGPIMAMAPDYQFLALVEYTCDHTFVVTGPWLLDHALIPPEDHKGRWPSYPMRYAKWRERFGYPFPPEDEEGPEP